MMAEFDIDAIRAQIRAADYPRGTSAEVALWREDLIEARAKLAIEGMELTAEDNALFAMMLEEGLSPVAIVEVLQSLSTR